LAYPAGGEPVLFDFFADALPRIPGRELDFFDVTVDFGPAQQVFHIGKGSAAVPGNVAGLLQVHRRLGSLPLPVILEPAITAAREGISIGPAQAYVLRILEPILSHEPNVYRLFHPNGRPLQAGDRFRNPAFADCLEQIAREGADFFYRGDGARQILAVMAPGGLLTEEALAAYRVVEREPLTTRFRGRTLFTNTVPSHGGPLIAFTLKLLEEGCSNHPVSTASLVHALYVTGQARLELVTGLDADQPLAELLSPAVFRRYLKEFQSGMDARHSNGDPPSRGATTHVSIIDRHGNAASVTTTNGEGCGYVVPELGIMLNNMLGEEDINPLGFHRWPRQRRLPTMIAPTVVTGPAGTELVLGSGGSNRIRSAILQVILNVLDRGLDLEAAVEAPRLHLEGNVLHHEPGIELPEKDLLSKGITYHRWDRRNLFFGGVNAVTPHQAAGDSRRGGVGRRL
jgi:gamma-glutamyltranspeptidase/glutathione hydrolase